MGASLPDDVQIVGIEADRVYEFSEELTPAVATAVPQAVQVVLNLLQINMEGKDDFA
jgi:Ni,Fe-hydrogenase maturation factor